MFGANIYVPSVFYILLPPRPLHYVRVILLHLRLLLGHALRRDLRRRPLSARATFQTSIDGPPAPKNWNGVGGRRLMLRFSRQWTMWRPRIGTDTAWFRYGLLELFCGTAGFFRGFDSRQRFGTPNNLLKGDGSWDSPRRSREPLAVICPIRGVPAAKSSCLDLDTGRS